ncbi:hypothetical protein BDY24DRAFT_377463 [Mrakia frigida]|uniref:uncharacterized protein n=1 Tax=Mrakia frigida TaxID=29902 RepID=UPI003FCBFD30
MSDPSASSSAIDPPPVTFFKKKSKPRPAARQRSVSPPPPSNSTSGPSSSSQAEASTSAVRLPTKKTVYNPLVQGTKRKSRKEEDWEREDMNDGTDQGVDVNWKASGRAKADDRSYVTGGLDWDADFKEEEEKKKRAKLVEDALQDGIPDDGMYHGAAAYKSHIEQREDGGSAKFKAGPVKASSNIRTITVIDYQPDVCKDYKETGWCGFGDTCKFLHDRGDYLSGWQMDEQHAKTMEAKRLAGDDVSDDEEEIPFACLICRKEFTDPVVTKCGHFFDSACAIKRFAKNPKCFACGTSTQGIFNSATAVLKKMEQKKKQREDARDELRGGPKETEGSDDDGGLRIESGDENDE